MRTRSAPLAAALALLGLTACTFDEPAHENLHEGERDPLLEELDEPQDNDYFGERTSPANRPQRAPIDACGQSAPVGVHLAGRRVARGDRRITTV